MGGTKILELWGSEGQGIEGIGRQKKIVVENKRR